MSSMKILSLTKIRGTKNAANNVKGRSTTILEQTPYYESATRSALNPSKQLTTNSQYPEVL